MNEHHLTLTVARAELRYGYMVAARLVAGEMTVSGGTFVMRATATDRNAYLLGKSPLTLRVAWGQTTKDWANVLVTEDGAAFTITGEGRPVSKGVSHG